MSLTTREKADRYDALQVAFEVTKKNYMARIDTHDKMYQQFSSTPIGAFSKGMADAYRDIVERLEAWKD